MVNDGWTYFGVGSYSKEVQETFTNTREIEVKETVLSEDSSGNLKKCGDSVLVEFGVTDSANIDIKSYKVSKDNGTIQIIKDGEVIESKSIDDLYEAQNLKDNQEVSIEIRTDFEFDSIKVIFDEGKGNGNSQEFKVLGISSEQTVTKIEQFEDTRTETLLAEENEIITKEESFIETEIRELEDILILENNFDLSDMNLEVHVEKIDLGASTEIELTLTDVMDLSDLDNHIVIEGTEENHLDISDFSLGNFEAQEGYVAYEGTYQDQTIQLEVQEQIIIDHS